MLWRDHLQYAGVCQQHDWWCMCLTCLTISVRTSCSICEYHCSASFLDLEITGYWLPPPCCWRGQQPNHTDGIEVSVVHSGFLLAAGSVVWMELWWLLLEAIDWEETLETSFGNTAYIPAWISHISHSINQDYSVVSQYVCLQWSRLQSPHNPCILHIVMSVPGTCPGVLSRGTKKCPCPSFRQHFSLY